MARRCFQVAVVAFYRLGVINKALRQIVHVHLRFGEQSGVVALFRKLLQRLARIVAALLVVVVVEHAAGLDAATADDALVRERDLAGLRRDGHELLGFDGPQRAQPQPVKPSADNAAIAEDQRGGSVVLLLVEREVGEHIAHVGGQRLVVLPGGRHHRHHRFDEVEIVVEYAGLQRLIEAAAVGLTRWADDQAVARPGHRGRRQPVFLIRGEFAVVGHQPEGLGHCGARLGVGRKARMEEQRVDGVVLVAEVLEVGDHLIGVEPAFEDLRARGERERVKPFERGVGVGNGLNGEEDRVEFAVE